MNWVQQTMSIVQEVEFVSILMEIELLILGPFRF
jgi:hypothetical protein